VSEDVVTRRAQQATNVTGLVVVVDCQLLSLTGRTLADVADASLCLVERLVLLWGESVPLTYPTAVSGLSEGLQAGPVVSGAARSRMRGGPLRARLTVLAEPLESPRHQINC
jgi:hypothetical protein